MLGWDFSDTLLLLLSLEKQKSANLLGHRVWVSEELPESGHFLCFRKVAAFFTCAVSRGIDLLSLDVQASLLFFLLLTLLTPIPLAPPLGNS